MNQITQLSQSQINEIAQQKNIAHSIKHQALERHKDFMCLAAVAFITLLSIGLIVTVILWSIN